MTATAVTATADAIVCGGALRPVVSGQVACPRGDATVQVEACGECRLLTWREDDRRSASACSTGPAQGG